VMVVNGVGTTKDSGKECFSLKKTTVQMKRVESTTKTKLLLILLLQLYGKFVVSLTTKSGMSYTTMHVVPRAAIYYHVYSMMFCHICNAMCCLGGSTLCLSLLSNIKVSTLVGVCLNHMSFNVASCPVGFISIIPMKCITWALPLLVVMLTMVV
jgi:hypothetical protein